MSDKQYSIRLADGTERTFDSAAEMAKWMAEQQEFSRSARKRNSRKPKRKPARKVRCFSGDSPLARYAKRNSDET